MKCNLCKHINGLYNSEKAFILAFHSSVVGILFYTFNSFNLQVSVIPTPRGIISYHEMQFMPGEGAPRRELDYSRLFILEFLLSSGSFQFGFDV
jgi:hypothetical protein